MREGPAERPGHLPGCLQGQQTSGRRTQHSTVYTRRSHLTPGTPKGRKPGSAGRTVRVEHGCEPISRVRPGNTESSESQLSPQVLGAEPRGWEATAPGLQARSVRPGSSTTCLSPGSWQTVDWNPQQRLPGGALGPPGASQRARMLGCPTRTG